MQKIYMVANLTQRAEQVASKKKTLVNSLRAKSKARAAGCLIFLALRYADREKSRPRRSWGQMWADLHTRKGESC